MNIGKKILGRRHVLSSVPGAIHEIMVEGTFKDGTYLVTVHQPICTDDGDIARALYGSFLPMPSKDLFPMPDSSVYAPLAQPGAVKIKPGMIVLNEGRTRTKLKVTNTGDRPIQVGSHYHFIETNPALEFDRAVAYGKRLDIPAGTAVRFEPGDSKTVTCVEIAGDRVINGGNNLASGKYDPSRVDEIVENATKLGFRHVVAQ